MADAARTISKTADSAPPSRVRTKQSRSTARRQPMAAPGSHGFGGKAPPPSPSQAFVSKVIAVGSSASNYDGTDDVGSSPEEHQSARGDRESLADRSPDRTRHATRQMAFAKIPGQIVAPIDGGPQPPSSVPRAMMPTQPEAPASRRGIAQSTTSKWPPAPSPQTSVDAVATSAGTPSAASKTTARTTPKTTHTQTQEPTTDIPDAGPASPKAPGTTTRDGTSQFADLDDPLGDDMALAMQREDPSLAWTATEEVREIDEVRARARRRVAYYALGIVAVLGIVEVVALSL